MPIRTTKKQQAGLLASQLQQNSVAVGADVNLAPHLLVRARAGSGKTTTLVEGLKHVKRCGDPAPWTPSQQQWAIFEAMQEGSEPRTIGFCAFNKSIASELQRRVPPGCDAMTLHSLGLKTVTRTFGRLDINGYTTEDLICRVIGKDYRAAKKQDAALLAAVKELVRLCKLNLTDASSDEAILNLIDYYEIEMEGSGLRLVLETTRQVLELARDPGQLGKINFDDMIWLPVALCLPVSKYDLLLVDEAQDLNRAQQELALKSAQRLVLVGDEKQAIYGFAGADCESLGRMYERLQSTSRGCRELPLTHTRRCGKAIVAEASGYVADFGCFDENPVGIINRALYPVQKTPAGEKQLPWEETYCALVREGDFLLCRVNAPLVRECFRFLKRGIRANIQGRDVGSGLSKLVNKLCGSVGPDSVTARDLTALLDDWLHEETEREQAKRHPNENKLIALTDRADCLKCFAEDAQTARDVLVKIDALFTDDPNRPGIKLSSIHKAKGLEAERVFFLRPFNGPCPHPMAKSPWQQEQEANLCYVAITRAIHELIYVS